MSSDKVCFGVRSLTFIRYSHSLSPKEVLSYESREDKERNYALRFMTCDDCLKDAPDCVGRRSLL